MHDRLLTRHFLQRFVDNDLVSPELDRHETLAVVCAALTTLSLFATALLSLKFLFQPFQSPGRTEILALDDRFLYIACSIIVMALVAVATWDALPLDARDESVLGILPVPRRAIMRAKLKAIAWFVLGFSAALNLGPTLLYPLLMASRLPIGAAALLTLVVAHGLITTAAGAFGFFSVWAIRELLRGLLGIAWFTRVSGGIQAMLVVCFLSVFFLLPSASSEIARSWMAPGTEAASVAPPLWFLGLHEAVAGQALDRLPSPDLPVSLAEQESASKALYRSAKPHFAGLATVALLALVTAAFVSVAGFAWNHRRPCIFSAAGARGRPRLGRTAFAGLIRHLIVRRPIGQAGFFFTLEALSRSAPHRVAIAVSVAVGLAASGAGLWGMPLRPVHPRSAPLALLAVQPLILVALLAGFQHAVRIPAELRANWIFGVTWPADERAFIVGVKRAALIAFVCPLLIALVPLHLQTLGVRAGTVHFVYGALWALLLTEAVMARVRIVPFASTYEPVANLKAVGPIAILVTAGWAYGFAFVERLTFATSASEFLLAGTLAALWLVTWLIGRRQLERPLWSPCEPASVSSAVPRLNLNG